MKKSVRCPTCDRKLTSEGQMAIGFCSRRCEDMKKQEKRSEKTLDNEVDKLMKQYEEQRKGK
jgi:endogenous inhibitor of DNA gyrase (YacG/DUF329 family)